MAKQPTRRAVPDFDPAGMFRVRDKNNPGSPGHVWGEDLSLEDATKLKNHVVGSRHSTTARVESMDVAGDAVTAPAAPPRVNSLQHPSNAMRRKQAQAPQARVPEHLRGEKQADPYLERVRQTALGVVTGEAAKAQQRADAIARKRQLETNLAKASAEVDALKSNLPVDFNYEDPPGVPLLEDELGVDPDAS